MKQLLHTVATNVVPFIASLLIRCWLGTCRVTVHGDEHLQMVKKSGKTGIASFWHYSLMVIFYQLRKEHAVAMVSASKDGDYIANLAKFMGFGTARGSRNKRGTGAMKQLIRAMKNGNHTALVADGSQGPPRKAQGGTILLASKTDTFILPMLWSASSYIAFNSWDRTAVPKPFSKIDYYYGEPFEVPSDASSDEVVKYRQLLEDRLNALYIKAWEKHGKENH